uniref:Uncharacterized protein n=1 Tax=Romanomermis culicivorax TaxID=13658 RepID=A0A915KRV9_ROMCU
MEYIGLSIDDIKEIQRNATLKRLTMQVDYHTDIEKRLPKSYLHRLNVSSRVLVVHPNRCSKRLIPSIQSIFGRKYQLVERSFEISANNDDQVAETVEKKVEKKLLHMQNQMDNVQSLLSLISQKLNIADESFDRSAMKVREREAIVDSK